MYLREGKKPTVLVNDLSRYKRQLSCANARTGLLFQVFPRM